MDKESGRFDHKWCLKSSLAQVPPLQPFQIANHYALNKHLTTKMHLLRNLRNLISQRNLDLDSFFPRAYDLDDQHDLDDFVEDFRLSHIRAFLSVATRPQGCPLYELKLTVALSVVNRASRPVSTLVSGILSSCLPIASPEEWSILNTPHPLPSPLAPSLDFLQSLLPKYID